MNKLANCSAEVDAQNSVKNNIGADDADFVSVGIFPLYHFGTENDVIFVFNAFCHGSIVPFPARNLEKLFVGFSSGDFNGIPGMKSKAVIPMPMRNGNKIRIGKPLFGKFGFQFFYIFGGISGFEKERIFFARNQPDIRAVGIGFRRAVIDAVGYFIKHGFLRFQVIN